MIAASAVDSAAHRIADQPLVEGGRLEVPLTGAIRRERLLGLAIRYELHAEEKAPSADIADMRMVIKPVLQMGHQFTALLLYPANQLFLEKRRHDGMRGGTGRRVSEIGMAMLEEAASRFDSAVDFGAAEHRANRLVTGTKTLCDGYDIGPDIIRLAGKKMARPPHAAHHLVKDEKHTMPVADLANTAEVAFNRRNGAKRRANNGLCNERHHRFRAKPLDFGLKFIGHADAKCRFVLAVPHLAIGVAG